MAKCKTCKGYNRRLLKKLYNKRQCNGYQYYCMDCKKPFKEMKL